MLRQLLHLQNVMYLNGGMMANERRGRVLVFTKAGEFAFNHVADSQGNYWLADDAESAIAERDAEIERLRAAIHDAANNIFFMPTWVEGDSYGAQIDMRRRCYEVVAAMAKVE